jgi:uncharacterized protein (UPF0303 family)
MGLKEDVAQLALQEQLLQFDGFDAQTAWALGSLMREIAVEREYKIAIEVRQQNLPLFYTALPGTSPDNADWLRRKRNVVERFHKSSYAIGLNMEQRGMTLVERYGVALADYAPNGGGFPVRVKAVGVVGFVGVSGLAQRDDHGFIVEALAHMLKVPLAEIALASE